MHTYARFYLGPRPRHRPVGVRPMLSALIGAALVVLALSSTIGAGLELSTEPLGERWRPVLSLLFANVVVLPVLGAIALAAAPIDGDTKIALWIVALAPGGASSPLLARAAGASPAVAGWGYLALALCSPALVWLGFARGAPSLASRSATIAAVGALQVLPLVLSAMAARQFATAARFARPLRSIGNAALAAVIAMLVIDRGPMLATLDARTLLAMLALVSATAGLGAASGAPRSANATLSIVRNLTLALLVCEFAALRRVAILVAAYGLVMYVMAAALSLYARRSHRR